MTEAAVEARAFAAMDRRLDVGSAAPLAVAASGGGDSTALLELAAEWARRAGRRVVVLHVDHGLNADSASWARLVAGHADRLKASFDVLSWTGLKPDTGLPAAARAARHALLAEAARAAGARVILMGHTADDVLEGEAMRAEGSSMGRLKDWGPSPAWPEGRGVMLLRPLLEVRRAELRAWLEKRGPAWIEDPANADPRSARARARRSLVEAAPLTTPAAPRLRPLAGLVSAGPGGTLCVERAAFAGLAQVEAAGLLSATLLCAGGGTRPPRGNALARLQERLRASGSVNATLAGARIVANGSGVAFGRDRGRSGMPELKVQAGQAFVWDARFEAVAEAPGRIRALAGSAPRLPAPQRGAVGDVPAPFRGTLPIHRTSSGAVALVEGRWLGLARLRGALGAVEHESQAAAPESG